MYIPEVKSETLTEAEVPFTFVVEITFPSKDKIVIEETFPFKLKFNSFTAGFG